MVAVRNVLLLFALATLAGCASMSSEECTVSEWYAVGFSDGARGMPVSRFDRYREDCSAHGVAPDFESYRSGRSEGLREYCQPERAFELGSRGHSNPGVCPANLRDGFADAFQAGRHLHELRTSLHRVERRLSVKNDRYLELQAQEHELEARLISAQPTVEERLQMLLELKNIGEELHSLQEEMLELEDEHAYHQQRLAAYEVSLYQSS